MGSELPSSCQNEAWRSSSSCARQGRSRVSRPYASRVTEAGPSNTAYRQHCEPIVDISERDQIPTRHDHMRMNPRFSDKKDKSANAMSGPSSTAPSQPVLVRSYSDNAKDSASKPPTISARRLFSFSSSKTSTSSRPGPTLPTEKDFSMANILQAIEPDIRGTLDSIAEICGRSKLSLANEYGSHIAPLGEIRVPPGGLVPVEEVSSSDERQAGEGIVVNDDDTGLVDTGGDLHPFSFHGYLEVPQQVATAGDRNAGGGTRASMLRASAHAAHANATIYHATQTKVANSASARQVASQPKSFGRDLLGKGCVSDQGTSCTRTIATPAVVSEIRVDAQADGGRLDSRPSTLNSDHEWTSESNPWHALEMLRPLLKQMGKATQDTKPETFSPRQSAEDRLRSTLQHSAEADLSCRTV